MNTKPAAFIVILLMGLSLSCGKPEEREVTLTGKVDLSSAGEISGPVFLALLATDDFNSIENDPLNSIIKVITLDYDGSFSVDLAELGLQPGDTVYLTAFIDNDYNGGIPFPTPGDYIGFYIDPNGNASYAIKEADNEVNITANRRVYDFSANLEGRILDDEAGSYLIIAYAGEINSLSTSAFDINNVIGYKRVVKPAGPMDYRLHILPYGADVPIENVYIIALHDKNGNGVPDPGDRIGFHTGESAGFPDRITINEGTTPGIDITMLSEIPRPSGYTVGVHGNLTMPVEYNASSPPVFVIIADASDPSAFFNNPTSAIREFSRLPPGTTSFDVDLSHAGVGPGDKVMVMALWDKDYAGGFPSPTPGDYVGFYIGPDLKTTYNIVVNGVDVNFSVNRRIYDFTANLNGRILDDEAGSYFVIAYTGDITSMNASAIDVNRVIGYNRVVKPVGQADYNLRILPYGFNVPIEKVYVIAIHDKNNNGLPDPGDRIGYYTGGSGGIPAQITVNEGTTPGIDITMQGEIPQPSGYNIRIQGNFTPPSGYNSSSPPAFVIVAEANDPAALSNNPTSSIREFYRLPLGTTSFDIDLSRTGLAPGDEVMVIALWDKDYTGGFPNPTPGDKLGFYENTDMSNFTYIVTLADGNNTAAPSGTWRFDINKVVYDYDTSVQFKIDPNGLPTGMSEDHNLIALVVHKDGVDDSGLIPDYSITDLNYVLGLSTLPYRQDSNFDYSFNIFNLIDDRIIDPSTMDVYIYVLYDRDGNGKPSTGDDIAVYWKNLTYTILGISITTEVPKIWTLKSDVVNVLSAPNDDAGNPYAVKFIGRTY